MSFEFQIYRIVQQIMQWVYYLKIFSIIEKCDIRDTIIFFPQKLYLACLKYKQNFNLVTKFDFNVQHLLYAFFCSFLKDRLKSVDLYLIFYIF